MKGTNTSSATKQIVKEHLKKCEESSIPIHPAMVLRDILNEVNFIWDDEIPRSNKSCTQRNLCFWLLYPGDVAQAGYRLSHDMIKYISDQLNVPHNLIMKIQSIYDWKLFEQSNMSPVWYIKRILVEQGIRMTVGILINKCFPGKDKDPDHSSKVQRLYGVLSSDDWGMISTTDIIRLCTALDIDPYEMLGMYQTYHRINILKEFETPIPSVPKVTGIWKEICELITDRAPIEGDLSCMLEDICNVAPTSYAEAIQKLVFDQEIPTEEVFRNVLIRTMADDRVSAIDKQLHYACVLYLDLDILEASDVDRAVSKVILNYITR